MAKKIGRNGYGQNVFELDKEVETRGGEARSNYVAISYSPYIDETAAFCTDKSGTPLSTRDEIISFRGRRSDNEVLRALEA